MSTLTQTQLDQLTQLLQTRRGTLLAEIREELARSGDERLSELLGGGDQGDEALATTLVDLDAAFLDRQVNEVRAIEAALTRVKDGNPNECAECGEDIGFARLSVQPTATRCIRCQERFEKSHANGGQPTL